ncbi:uncharacterized protein MELLADRAFT_59941 [Melampsora larici-populina 98AG31]|uniref:Uncharacterized protein n=1 Tax=Melampsora larici-populina (strain 98AG31 / pathotype 3-4-7) TaxID=747676 RepID=F4R9C6_MELLP|nr:uncharacterized protein MELLADRAFT_59941 [Melampsora larici-populina 98AG31]EGG11180.1 hypothetical protein MELLADRAFT_59941 [Melampsora larici-populina 98AG31]
MLPDYSDSSPNSPTPIITNNDTSTFTSSAQIDTHSIILPDYSDNSCPNSHTHLITKKDTPAFNPSPQIDSNSFMLPDYPDTSSPNSPAPLITKKDPSTSGGQIDPNSFILPDYSDDSSPKSPTTLITKNNTQPFKQIDEPMQYQILHSDPTIPLSVSYMGSDLIMKLLNKDVGSRINSYSDLMSHDFFTCKFIV